MGEPRPWEANYPPALRDYILDLSDMPAHPADFCAEAVRAYADRPAFSIVRPNALPVSLSFVEVDELSNAFSNFLLFELQLSRGDALAIQLPNGLHYPVAVFGAWKAGLIITLINPMYTPTEVERQLADSGARALICSDLFQGTSDGAAASLAIPRVVASFEDFPMGLEARSRGRAGCAAGGSGSWRFPEALAGRPRTDPRRRHPVALYQYTGGTTGRSKAAVITGQNIRATLKMTGDFLGAYGQAPDRATALTVLPLYHIFAFMLGLLQHYRAGSHNILVPNPRPIANLRSAFEGFPINWMAGVDTLYAGLLGESWFRANPPRLGYALTGGTATRPGTMRDWEALVGPMVEGYGLTETTCIVCSNPPGAMRRAGTVGLPLPGCDVRIVDERGSDCAPGERGELIVRGPQVVPAYRGGDSEDAAAFHDGWFHTGDIGRLRSDGYIEIVDRKKDMILVSGFNVYPNEVEAVIAAHPDIVEVAVVGVPDERTGEAVTAFVVASSPGIVPNDIVEHCRSSLTAYKVPARIHFRDALPKSPVGKILRARLRVDACQDE